MNKNKIATWVTILSFPIVGTIVSHYDLGEALFNSNKPKIVEKEKLYSLPGNYFTSKENLEDLFRLTKYDENKSYKDEQSFNPNMKTNELLKTCLKTDANLDKFLTESEIKERLKIEYHWDPQPF